MALTAGALSKVLIGSDAVSLLSAAASGGTGPYTYQWYFSTDSSFTPGVGNIIDGATALSLSKSDLLPLTAYTFKVIATDTGASNATVTSTGLTITTMEAAGPDISQFEQSPALGELDLAYNYNTISVMISESETATLLSGQAVKVEASAGGVPKVLACTASTDAVFGFINFNFKKTSFIAGDYAEISQDGNVIYLRATTAINRGAQVTLDVTSVGGVASVAAPNRIVGIALDQPSIGQLFRVELKVLGSAVAS